MSQALIDELSKPEYASLSDEAAADAINAKTVTIRVLVDLWQIEEYARRNGIRALLKKAEGNAQHDCQDIAIDILAYITSPRGKMIDLDLAETQTMFGAMVSCGFATATHVSEMTALADQVLRWVDHVSAGTQSAHSVRVIRDVINGATAKRDGWTQQNVDRYNTVQAAIDAWKHGDPELVI
jgi:hypothetical protein